MGETPHLPPEREHKMMVFERARHVMAKTIDSTLGVIVNKLRDAEIEELKHNDRSQEDTTD